MSFRQSKNIAVLFGLQLELCLRLGLAKIRFRSKVFSS